MPASGGEANEFERLKTLLFSPEADRLSAAETHIHDLASWVGDAPRLESATAQVLVEAFRRAEVARHRELAAAVAPVVVAAIRSEIANSRDMMVEALYPITGRLVAAAVANAFSELLDAINQRIEALVSTQQWRLRFRSIVTGRSVAEIALSEAREAVFERILLLERGSGRLLAHWKPGAEGQDNPDLISGMLAAISEFASTVLSEQHGELRTLDLGASQVFLRASSRVILAAELTGPVSRKHRENLDAGFLDLVARNDRGETLGEADLAALAAVSTKPAKKRAGWAAWVFLAMIAAGLCAWAWNGPFYRWRKEAAIADAYAQALAADPKSRPYPLVVNADWSANVVTLKGLAASRGDVDEIVKALTPAAAPLKVRADVAIIASTDETKALRETNAAQSAELARLNQSLSEQSARLREADGRLAEAKAESASLAARVDEIAMKVSANRAAAEAAQVAAKGAQDAALEDAKASAAALTPRIEQLADAVASNRVAAETAQAGAGERIARLEGAVEAARRALSAPRRAIAEAAGDAVLFFAERDGFADHAAAAKALDVIAESIKATGEGVRVVGYADETGGPVGNIEVSRLRAAAVAKLLVDRGVSSNLLVVVGRGAIWPIADAASNRLRNRRVVFEPLYAGETP